MIDVLFSILILATTLTSSYGLIIKTVHFKDRAIEKVDTVLENSETYDKDIQGLFK